MESLVHDLRFALRNLAGNPGLALAIVLTLALGIGANIAIFTVAKRVVLDPLPHLSAFRNLAAGLPRPARRQPQLPIPDGAGRGNFTLTGDGTAERLRAVLVTPEFFDVYGRPPARGRPITA